MVLRSPAARFVLAGQEDNGLLEGNTPGEA
jgi:hypothetical protein